MQIIETVKEAHARAAENRKRRVLVPTMGALHNGHLELLRTAREAACAAGEVAVSIFVNPLQFEPGADFDKYPRPQNLDEELCRRAGVDILFRPAAGEMYFQDASVTVEEHALSKTLCGKSRPGHFRGVCTVVTKLFHLLAPDAAVFGEKDFQQLAIIRRMVRDLDFPIEIIGAPTVREPDGLACSSRNQYLNEDERRQAPVLRAALVNAAERVRAGEKSAREVVTAVTNQISTAPSARIDYVEIVDAETIAARCRGFRRQDANDRQYPARMKQYDFVVIGSGIAGLTFAVKASKHGSVAVITKRKGADSNTAWAQGGVACVTSDEDSFELHVRDTLEAGAGLCDEAAVRTIVAEGPARIRELVEVGLQFDERVVSGHREPDLGREGGHSKRRILHVQDVTGLEIENTLLRELGRSPGVELLENHMAVDLITAGKLGFATEDRCLGAYVLDERTGEVETIRTDRLVLATGGCGKVYLYTTNPDIATGDGVAMAWRAGATIANMEFVQFHPTCLFHPEAKSFLISEAVRGEGGILRNSRGEDFMLRYDPRASLAPRDIVARAIDAEIKRSGAKCVFLDITHKEPEFLRERFPHIYETCLRFGIDMTKQPIPVVPAAHYQCGGVKTDVNGATSLPGLSAIGEVACTGLHGANRLASNSLLEGLVVAHRACEALTRDRPPGHAARDIALPEWQHGNAQDLDELVVIYHNWDEIRRLMWDYVGIVRTDKRLQRASARLRNLQREIREFYWNFRITVDLLELRNLATVAALIVDSALSRKESRGLHFTLDHQQLEDRHFNRDTLLNRL
jgi:L-aspartate oxidase